MYWKVKTSQLSPGSGHACPHFHAVCLISIYDVNCKFANNDKSRQDTFLFGCETNTGVELSLGFGEGDLSGVVDDCLQSMKEGEIKNVDVHVLKDYGSLKSDDSVAFTIKLVWIDQGTVLYKLTSEECIDLAQKFKEIGTRLFKEQRVHVAASFYIKALKHLIILSSTDDPMANDAHLLSVVCHSNLAACQLKLRQYDKVVQNCSDALKIEKSHLKCLFRRASAYLALGDCDKAEIDVALGLKIEPKNRELISFKAKLNKIRATEDKKLAQRLEGMFNSK